MPPICHNNTFGTLPESGTGTKGGAERPNRKALMASRRYASTARPCCRQVAATVDSRFEHYLKMMKNLLTALLGIAFIFAGIAYLHIAKENRQLAEQLRQTEEKAKLAEAQTTTLRDVLQTLEAVIPQPAPQQQSTGPITSGTVTSPTPAEPAGSPPAAPESAELQPEAVSPGEVSKHSALIRTQVERAWSIPPGSPSNLVCIVKIELLPSGEVHTVRVAQSSGDAAFDRSVLTAVKKAAPFPMPEDPEVAARFRSFNFKFRPRG